jgi:hypothetical protein
MIKSINIIFKKERVYYFLFSLKKLTVMFLLFKHLPLLVPYVLLPIKAGTNSIVAGK